MSQLVDLGFSAGIEANGGPFLPGRQGLTEKQPKKNTVSLWDRDLKNWLHHHQIDFTTGERNIVFTISSLSLSQVVQLPPKLHNTIATINIYSHHLVFTFKPHTPLWKEVKPDSIQQQLLLSQALYKINSKLKFFTVKNHLLRGKIRFQRAILFSNLTNLNLIEIIEESVNKFAEEYELVSFILNLLGKGRIGGDNGFQATQEIREIMRGLHLNIMRQYDIPKRTKQTKSEQLYARHHLKNYYIVPQCQNPCYYPRKTRNLSKDEIISKYVSPCNISNSNMSYTDASLRSNLFTKLKVNIDIMENNFNGHSWNANEQMDNSCDKKGDEDIRSYLESEQYLLYQKECHESQVLQGKVQESETSRVHHLVFLPAKESSIKRQYDLCMKLTKFEYYNFIQEYVVISNFPKLSTYYQTNKFEKTRTLLDYLEVNQMVLSLRTKLKLMQNLLEIILVLYYKHNKKYFPSLDMRNILTTSSKSIKIKKLRSMATYTSICPELDFLLLLHRVIFNKSILYMREPDPACLLSWIKDKGILSSEIQPLGYIPINQLIMLICNQPFAYEPLKVAPNQIKLPSNTFEQILAAISACIRILDSSQFDPFKKFM